MKKLLSMLCSLALCGAAVFGFAGCSKEDPAKTLYVELSNAGFGINWIDPLIDIFEEEHPGITVKKTYLTKQDSAMVGKVTSGATHIDILFPESDEMFNNYNQSLTVNGVKYDSPYADLTDIYNAKVPGEDITLKDKMDASYRAKAALTVNGEERFYTTPWMQAPMGIAINNKIYKEEYGKLPNTTNELLDYCKNLKKKGVTPFIHSIATSYFNDIYDVWVCQYNGRENQKKFYEGYAICGDHKGERYVPDMFDDDGIREALRFLEELLSPDNEYFHRLSSLDFTQVQNTFLEGDQNILFMPTGAWLEREMEANYDPGEVDINYIDMPVISALGKKLGITDAELSAIIDYVDGDTATEPAFTSTVGTSKADVIAAVREARSMTPSLNQYNAIIPSYSSKIGLAKEFLQLMASDRGMEAMLENCGSCTPYKYDISTSPVKDKISPLMYSINVLAEKGYTFFKKDDLFRLNALQLVNGSGSGVVGLLASTDAGYRKSADELVDSSVSDVASMWQSFMQKLGGGAA